jgi:hypothetical protein
MRFLATKIKLIVFQINKNQKYTYIKAKKQTAKMLKLVISNKWTYGLYRQKMYAF